MKKDPIVFIEHILECIELIEEYTRGVTKEEFFKSKQLQDSVIRRIEVIGEAAKNIFQEISFVSWVEERNPAFLLILL